MIGHVTPAKVEEAVPPSTSPQSPGSCAAPGSVSLAYPCPGMLDVGVDEADLQKALGVTTVHLDLDALLNLAQAASPEDAASAARGSSPRPAVSGT